MFGRVCGFVLQKTLQVGKGIVVCGVWLCNAIETLVLERRCDSLFLLSNKSTKCCAQARQNRALWGQGWQMWSMVGVCACIRGWKDEQMYLLGRL